MFIKSAPLTAVLLVGSTLALGGCGADSPDTSVAEPVQDEAVELGTTEQAVYYGWTPYTSDELAPVVCDGGSLPKAVQCSGRYCDNMRMECQDTGGARGASYWSTYISDEYAYSFITCNPGYWMTGLACSGSYCDRISIQCSYMGNFTAKNCFDTGWYSEENVTPFSFPVGYYPRGMRCSGSFCDNVRFTLCQP